jgi:TolB-like protein
MKRTATPLSPHMIKQQLQRLLKQEEFKKSPVLTRFLELVVLTKLAGREHEIKGYTIAVKALGRPACFNSQTDAIVRIHAGRLRVVLNRYYNNAGKYDPIIINIPKGTYIPQFHINNGDLEHKLYQQTSATTIQIFGLTEKKISEKPVLAVLPFSDQSREKSNGGFLSALGAQLNTELARFDNLSIVYLKAIRKPDAAINEMEHLRNKGVDCVLTGGLKSFNGAMSFNIQLKWLDTGTTLWSDCFHTQLTEDNALDIRDEITSQVENAIARDPTIVKSLYA